MSDIAYILERIIFGTVCLITFALFTLKYTTSANNATIISQKLKLTILLVNFVLGTICIDPHKQNIYSPILIRILIRTSTLLLLCVINMIFDAYFQVYCEKIYNASFIGENEQNTQPVSVAYQPSKIRIFINLIIKKPENITDNQIWYDILIYSNWYFIVGIGCLIASFFYLHTFLFHTGICFMLTINAIQLHYKWVPYRIAYVHRIPLNFEEYKFIRLTKHIGIWIFLFITWLLSVAIIHNATLFNNNESSENIIECENLTCNKDDIPLDYICFISSIFGLVVLLKFFTSDPIIYKQPTQIHKEESKTNNSPRPGSDITSSVENLSFNDKAMIAKFLASTSTGQTENIFIPLNQTNIDLNYKTEQTDEGKT